jgi:hypothetical protein
LEQEIGSISHPRGVWEDAVAEKKVELNSFWLALEASTRSKGVSKETAKVKLQVRNDAIVESEAAVQDGILQELEALKCLVTAANGMGEEAYRDVSVQQMKGNLSYVWLAQEAHKQTTAKLSKTRIFNPVYKQADT